VSAVKAESVPKGFGADPLNLIQVMLAKGATGVAARNPSKAFPRTEF
jgi:hypothetical protein